jgi:hypothetical protein
MPRIFVDSGVVILAARGESPSREAALRLLEDPSAHFLTSPFIYLEIVPQAAFHRRDVELDFYQVYFRYAESCEDTAQIVQHAVRTSTRCGIAPMDALHVAAANLMQANLLITAEKPGKSIYRADNVQVRYYLEMS